MISDQDHSSTGDQMVRSTWTQADLKDTGDTYRGPSDAQVTARNLALQIDQEAMEIMRQISLITKAEAVQLATFRRMTHA